MNPTQFARIMVTDHEGAKVVVFLGQVALMQELNNSKAPDAKAGILLANTNPTDPARIVATQESLEELLEMTAQAIEAEAQAVEKARLMTVAQFLPEEPPPDDPHPLNTTG